MDWSDLTRRCASWVENPSTRAAYREDWQEFAEWFLAEHDRMPDPEHVDRDDIEAHLDDQTLSTNRKVSAFRKLFDYANRAGVRDDNPAKAVPTPHVTATFERVLTEPERVAVRGLVADPESSPTRSRDLAVLALFRGGGLKTGEVVALREYDVEITPHGVTVYVGRANPRRTPLDAESAGAVADYVERSRPMIRCREQALILNKHGNEITPRSIQRIVRRLGEEVGVERLSPNHLRATRAVELLQRYSAVVVAAMLGFENVYMLRRMAEAHVAFLSE